MDMIGVGRRIAELRRGRDMTQVGLADLMGVSFQAVSSWERGLTMPDISRLPELAGALAVTVDGIVGSDMVSKAMLSLAESGDAGDASLAGDGDASLSLSDVAEMAPILKPSQMDALVERAAEVGGVGELCGIAPFVSRGVLDRLAARGLGHGG